MPQVDCITLDVQAVCQEHRRRHNCRTGVGTDETWTREETEFLRVIERYQRENGLRGRPPSPTEYLAIFRALGYRQTPEGMAEAPLRDSAARMAEPIVDPAGYRRRRGVPCVGRHVNGEAGS